MHIIRRGVRLTTASAILGLATIGTAGAAVAITIRPATADNCGNAYNFYTCAEITGSLEVVDSGYANSHDTAAGGENVTFHTQFTWPTGATICNGPTETDTAGTGDGSSYCGWDPNGATEPPGSYCATTWVYVGGGSYDNDGRDCVNVIS